MWKDVLYWSEAWEAVKNFWVFCNAPLLFFNVRNVQSLMIDSFFIDFSLVFCFQFYSFLHFISFLLLFWVNFVSFLEVKDYISFLIQVSCAINSLSTALAASYVCWYFVFSCHSANVFFISLFMYFSLSYIYYLGVCCFKFPVFWDFLVHY